MTIIGVLLRFFVGNILLTSLAGFIIGTFHLKYDTPMKIIILLVLIHWTCTAFAKKNGRFFTKDEKRWVVLGMIGIDISWKGVAIYAALSLNNLPLQISTPALVALCVTSLVHALVIYVLVSTWRKRLIRQEIISG